jgi:hypothetical protein
MSKVRFLSLPFYLSVYFLFGEKMVKPRVIKNMFFTRDRKYAPGARKLQSVLRDNKRILREQV